MREEERGGVPPSRAPGSLRSSASRPTCDPSGDAVDARLSRRLDQRPTFTSFCCAVRKNEYNLLRERL